MMRATGRPTFVGGNLGEPLAEAVGTPAAGPGGVCVVEASSFQLETVETLSPARRRAAEHHRRSPGSLSPTWTRYAAAKARIFARADAPTTSRSSTPTTRWPCAVSDGIAGRAPRLLGRRATLAEGGVAGVDGDDARACGCRAARPSATRRTLPALVGRHNQANALAALLASRLAGRDAGAGAARRCAPSGRSRTGWSWSPRRGGVAYYDDSKGTNVGAVVAALDGFPRPVVLIAGGRDKGGDYAPLAAALRARGPGRGADRRGAPTRSQAALRGRAAGRARRDDGRRRRRRATPGAPGRRRGAVARLLQLRHVPRLRAPRRGVPRRGGARRRRGARPVKPPARRTVIRRVASPGAAALKARAVRRDRDAAQPHQGRRAGGLGVDHRLARAGCAATARPRAPSAPARSASTACCVGAVLALAAFGVVMVFSSGAVFAAKKYGDATYFLKRELIYAILGLGALSLRARIDYSIYRRLAYPLLFVSPGAAGRRAEDRLARGRRHPLVPRWARCRSSPASWRSSRSASTSRTCSPARPRRCACSRSASCRRCWSPA